MVQRVSVDFLTTDWRKYSNYQTDYCQRSVAIVEKSLCHHLHYVMTHDTL